MQHTHTHLVAHVGGQGDHGEVVNNEDDFEVNRLSVSHQTGAGPDRTEVDQEDDCHWDGGVDQQPRVRPLVWNTQSSVSGTRRHHLETSQKGPITDLFLFIYVCFTGCCVCKMSCEPTEAQQTPLNISPGVPLFFCDFVTSHYITMSHISVIDPYKYGRSEVVNITEPIGDTVSAAGSGVCELTNQRRLGSWGRVIKRQELKQCFTGSTRKLMC